MSDENFMREALRIAGNACGRTSPNPMVGAVIVRDGRIIAEGWHREAGTSHAEVHALTMAGELAKGAVLYVTLEPCAHYGRTGPCAKAVAEAGISRVVIGMEDPNPLVSGRGIEILKEAGIDVRCGVLEDECRRLNRTFLKWITTGFPFVAMKTAMTLDGKIATAAGKSKWITSEESRRRVHEIRDRFDGIMAGIGTVISDNPSLTTRLADGSGKNPVRIIADSMGRTPLDSVILNDKKAPVIIAVTQMAPEERIRALRDKGAEILVAGKGPRVDFPILMKQLGERELLSILVEGGGNVNFSLLRDGLVDQVYAFIAPKLVGGSKALSPVEGEGFGELSDAVELEDVTYEMLGKDILLTGYVIK